MRKHVIVAAICVLVGATAACGPKSESATSPVTPKPSTTSNAPDAGGFIIEPGRIGPYKVGMTSKQLLDAGLAQKPGKNECPTLQAVGKDIGLQFDYDKADKPLTAVLLKSAGPHTPEGIQVGDTVDHLQATVGGKLVKQTGMYGEIIYVLTDGTKAIGFAATDRKIDAIEVFEGSDVPAWDGC